MTDTTDTPPNILCIVWDACRADYAAAHTSNLDELAGENVLFEDAVAPAPWSLPSHASMLSGRSPAEHGSCRVGDSMGCRTAELLSDRGYTCYGVSANGFASQRTGFDESFDEFFYTGGRDLYPEGIDVSGRAQGIMRAEGKGHSDALWEILRSIPANEHSLKSLVNLFAVGCGELALSVEGLQRIPHPWFAPDSGYCYDPTQNTDRLERLLADEDGPFFVFMNYMDTHRPYKPSEDRQRSRLGETLSRRELRRLNESVAHPSKFLEAVETGELAEDDVETLRELYIAELERVDEELGEIRSVLERTGHREDTLVAVTSDHGENLGETDDMGHRRMGHEASVSDTVLSVPLVVAHPELDARTVEDRVSLTDLHHLFVDGADRLLESGGDDLGGLGRDEPVVSHYPAVGAAELFERYPDAPREALAFRVEVDVVVAYSDDWKVVVASNGDRWARAGEAVVDYQEVPSELRELSERELSELESGESEALSDEELSQLEALGYI